ncbi:MAG TPA: hypothetical protein VG028_03300 [Terriglobia bacterium]|nr:hypothetical protein [Terriglobia bacterium]
MGSFASSSHGFARFTQDEDFIVKLDRFHIDQFTRAFSKDFYIDRRMIESALSGQAWFTIIHFESSFKVDFFILRKDRFSEVEFSRRLLKQLNPGTDFFAYIQTPEDSILSKLVWYWQGGEVLENQWRDVMGMLKLQAGRLDIEYLEKWAQELGISDLLKRARQEVET